MAKRKPFDLAEQEEILRLYRAGEPLNDLSERFHRSDQTIKTMLVSAGQEIRHGRDASGVLRYFLNQYAFDHAETDQQAAYWVGFLMADGCVTKNNSSQVMIVTLAEIDIGHLVKLRQFLGSDHPVRTYDVPERTKSEAHGGGVFRAGRRAVLRIPCDRLCAYLGRYGVLPRKTDYCRVRLLENNPHFWRGVIDGDGCMAMAQSGRARAKHPRIQLVGHFELLGQFKQYVESFTGSTTNVKRWGGHCWHISVNGHWAIQVLHRLYHGAAVSLDRKSVIVEQMLADWPLDPTRRFANAGEVKAARKAVGATIYA